MSGGTVEHGDSLGNHGAIAAGDVQWMTAGSGIIHRKCQRRPHRPDARFSIVGQSAFLAEDDRAAISGSEGSGYSVATDDDGTSVRIVCGNFRGVKGPVDGVAAEPCISTYPSAWQAQDAAGETPAMPSPMCSRSRQILQRIRAAIGADEGVGWADTEPPPKPRTVPGAVRQGDEVTVQADETASASAGFRQPLEEPVAWYGPIVMNTRNSFAKRSGNWTAGHS